MSRTLLSVGVGAPIALLAMALWFSVERLNLRDGARAGVVRLSAVLVTVALLALVVARFVKYS
jgi:hypothetical protein